MKKINYLLLILLVACGTTKNTSSTQETTTAVVQEPEKINLTVPYRESVMLLGLANKDGFTMQPFNTWFNSGYDAYTPDEAIVKELSSKKKGITIKAFMGTWCGDSKRETPRFYKILDAINFDQNKLTFYTVDRTKTTPEGFEKDLNIFRVPTFIFYKDGKEINRIVEFPVETLEKDMLTILSGKEYKHSYDK